jgi:metacaspase-1
VARGLSIHIGLNSVDPGHYGGWDGKLKACEYDAKDMAAVAEENGFEAETLLTKQASAKAVKDAIGRAATDLAGEDLLFLTYSGHGGQVPDRNGGDEPDRQDETWVLFDRQLVDDELFGLWSRFERGVRIFVLSDSCHSGSVTRDLFDAATPQVVAKGMVDDEQPRTKDMPTEVQDETYARNSDVYDEIQREHEAGDTAEVGASVLLISGCQDNQLSLDGSRNGLFTQTLLRVWDGGGFRGGHRALWKAIQAQMPPTQSPNFFAAGLQNRAFVRQRPLTI